jgi:hypothetical protein
MMFATGMIAYFLATRETNGDCTPAGVTLSAFCSTD